ncbi:MAG: LamG domain-containing protein [Dysgonamonadaceae bacterium]|nr:LamG domain-containing protein [Dysgonamonadaceae bacterium]
MKNKKQIFIIMQVAIIAIMVVALQSCFQDLGQNPPFDYPEQPVPPPIGADGQMFYMDFEDNYEEFQSLGEATVVGSPGFAEGKKGLAYAGAKDSYLTFGTANLASPLTSTMTFSFWYKVNGDVERAGLLVIAPKTEGAPADQQNNRTAGIRIFRESAGDMQRIKANIGNGEADSWLDGGDKADIDPTNATWKFITLVLTQEKAILYIDGEVVASSDVTVSWKGCDIMSIGSGSPRFNEWGHKSDNSLIDELRIYNKAMTVAEVKAKFEGK